MMRGYHAGRRGGSRATRGDPLLGRLSAHLDFLRRAKSSAETSQAQPCLCHAKTLPPGALSCSKTSWHSPDSSRAASGRLRVCSRAQERVRTMSTESTLMPIEELVQTMSTESWAASAKPYTIAAQRSSFKTSDGVSLSAIEVGQGRGPTLLFLPGWSQSAALFAPQLEALKDDFHCIALDHRGHGESEDAEHGYRISRLAQDVHEFITARGLTDVTLLGHSMGAAVMWAYWDIFGKERLSKMVIIDQPPSVMKRDDLSEQASLDAGAIFTWTALMESCAKLAGPDPKGATEQFVGGMLSERLPASVRDWVIQENLKFPRAHAATLLTSCSTNDWRDILPRIDVPVLVVGGKASCVPWQSQVWIHQQVPNSRLEMFEEEEGGYHFMFLENPPRFNAALRSFLKSP